MAVTPAGRCLAYSEVECAVSPDWRFDVTIGSAFQGKAWSCRCPSRALPSREPSRQEVDAIPRARIRIAVVAACVALLLVAAAPAGAARSDDRLALQPADVPSMSSASAGVGSARQALSRVLPRALRERARPLRIEASAFRQGAGRRATRLSAQAYVLRNAGAATAALTAWRSAQRRAGVRPTPVAIGTPAAITARRRSGVSDVTIALRAGAGLAVVRYRSTATLARARPVAVALARIEADRLRRALDRTVADRVLDGIRPDGSIPLRTLLQLTELAYGDVPGVSLPAGRPGGGAPDATVVLAALRERAAELSPAQRRAVEATVWPRVRQSGRRTRAVDPVTGCRDDTLGGCRPTPS